MRALTAGQERELREIREEVARLVQNQSERALESDEQRVAQEREREQLGEQKAQLEAAPGAPATGGLRRA
ncbi:MAG: hypothetical protein G8D58_09115 [gamma proteobacterium symbiont of Phacoides pectinatus]